MSRIFRFFFRFEIVHYFRLPVGVSDGKIVFQLTRSGAAKHFLRRSKVIYIYIRINTHTPTRIPVYTYTINVLHTSCTRVRVRVSRNPIICPVRVRVGRTRDSHNRILNVKNRRQLRNRIIRPLANFTRLGSTPSISTRREITPVHVLWLRNVISHRFSPSASGNRRLRRPGRLVQNAIAADFAHRSTVLQKRGSVLFCFVFFCISQSIYNNNNCSRRPPEIATKSDSA